MADVNRKGRAVDFGVSARWVLLIIIILTTTITTAIMNNFSNRSDAEVIDGTISPDNGDTKINWERFSRYDIDLSESLTISSSGVYHLTGTIENGNIKINVPDGKVKLILDNVSITNLTGPVIECASADDLVIELIGDNVLEDGSTYASSYDEDVSGAIYSKADLTFEGSGVLNLTANYQDGIVGKDDIKFISGVYVIDANDDGIRGKDSVFIVDGDFTITAKADAIKSTNDMKAGKGFVLIEDGVFSINAGAKGIKAVNSILIHQGDYTITSTDDAIHSNNYVEIKNGEFEIMASDDGIHADKKLIIDDGEIAIKKSYEGIEAQAITINGGKISVVSSDDGINAGGGADNSAANRPGAGAFSADISCVLTINDGDVYINASGDGLDSNGYVYLNGGSVVVDGPTNNGNGALDAGAGIIQTGGTVVAVGASGMAESLGSDSTVYNASIYFNSNLPAKSKVQIKNSAGATIISHTSAKSFNHMAVGSTEFALGETYTIYVDGSKYDTFTISNITTVVGNVANMGPNNEGANNVGPGGVMPNESGENRPSDMESSEKNGEVPNSNGTDTITPGGARSKMAK